MEPISVEPIFNFQGSTLLSVLVFLGTAAMLWALGVSFVILLARGNGFAARRVATAGAGVAGAYLAVLAGLSVVSPASPVEPGNARSARESDCHPAASAVDASARVPVRLPEPSPAGNAEVGR
ncbi:MAG TPA: hypothetical protein VGB15_03085 [Longimicrobium sp.]|jgi:hypothetical protein